MRDEVLHLGKLVDDLQELALAEARELRLDIGSVSVEPVVLSAARAAGLEKESAAANRDRAGARPGRTPCGSVRCS